MSLSVSDNSRSQWVKYIKLQDCSTNTNNKQGVPVSFWPNIVLHCLLCVCQCCRSKVFHIETLTSQKNSWWVTGGVLKKALRKCWNFCHPHSNERSWYPAVLLLSYGCVSLEHSSGFVFCCEMLTSFSLSFFPSLSVSPPLSLSLSVPRAARPPDFNYNTDGYEGEAAEDGKCQDGSETMPYIDESPTMSPQLCTPRGPDGVSPTPPEGLLPGVRTHTRTHAHIQYTPLQLV